MIRGHIVDLRVLAELKDADVGGDAPPVVGFDARSVAGHRAETVGDDVEEMSHRRFDQT